MATNAYCVKCKAKRDMQNEQKITMKNGKPATEGKARCAGPRCSGSVRSKFQQLVAHST